MGATEDDASHRPAGPSGPCFIRNGLLKLVPRRSDVLAVGALLVAGAGLFSHGLHTRTNYDEGVYLASLDALRHGQELGSDVFASQPPGFYLLLRAIGLFAGRSVEGLRIGMVVVALVGVAAAFLIGRRFAGLARSEERR